MIESPQWNERVEGTSHEEVIRSFGRFMDLCSVQKKVHIDRYTGLDAASALSETASEIDQTIDVIDSAVFADMVAKCLPAEVQSVVQHFNGRLDQHLVVVQKLMTLRIDRLKHSVASVANEALLKEILAGTLLLRDLEGVYQRAAVAGAGAGGE